MGLRPTQGDEKRSVSSNRSPWKLRPPLCHPDRSVPGFPTSWHSQEPRMRLSVEKGARSSSTLPRSTGNLGERSGGICSSADLSWKCSSTELSGVGRFAVSFPVLTHPLLPLSPSRPGGPPAKRQPSPEGLGWIPIMIPPAPACRGSAIGAAPILSSTILRRGETGDVVGPQGPTVSLPGSHTPSSAPAPAASSRKTTLSRRLHRGTPYATASIWYEKKIGPVLLVSPIQLLFLWFVRLKEWCSAICPLFPPRTHSRGASSIWQRKQSLTAESRRRNPPWQKYT
jgi:hypothetical protein